MRTKGQPKTGGRGKGTPNKTTSTVREWLTKLIDDSRRQVVKDLKLLEPKDRLLVLEKFMQYTTPKMQAVTVDAEVTSTQTLLHNGRRLEDMSNEELQAIIDGKDV